EAANPPPYFNSLVNLTVNGKTLDADMIAPKSPMTINLPRRPGNKLASVFLNDYGAQNEFEATLK
ncbi:pilus assembly protein PapD, partial [Cronobacter sakazakii]